MNIQKRPRPLATGTEERKWVIQHILSKKEKMGPNLVIDGFVIWKKVNTTSTNHTPSKYERGKEGNSGCFWDSSYGCWRGTERWWIQADSERSIIQTNTVNHSFKKDVLFSHSPFQLFSTPPFPSNLFFNLKEASHKKKKNNYGATRSLIGFESKIDVAEADGVVVGLAFGVVLDPESGGVTSERGLLDIDNDDGDGDDDDGDEVEETSSGGGVEAIDDGNDDDIGVIGRGVGSENVQAKDDHEFLLPFQFFFKLPDLLAALIAAWLLEICSFWAILLLEVEEDEQR